MNLIPRTVAACIALGVTLLASAQVEAPFLNWTITVEKPSGYINQLGKLVSEKVVRARSNVCFKNLTRGQHFMYQTYLQPVGVNLGWVNTYEDTPFVLREARMVLELANPKSTATPGDLIRLGQPLAIKIGTAGYLRIENRTLGIDLGFSKTPVYDWYLIGVGRPEDVIRPDMKIGILHKSGRSLVHQNRRIGFELGWWRYFPPLPPHVASNSTLQAYKSNDAQIRPLIKRLDRINPPLSELLRKTLGVK